tara:strand:+ start:244 stop:399 length:156 start_codon:yes stop_codon:yes gene_type:complete
VSRDGEKLVQARPWNAAFRQALQRGKRLSVEIRILPMRIDKQIRVDRDQVP